MEEKVRVVIELDKNAVQAAAFWADTQISDELWKQMTSEPISFPMEEMGEQSKEMELGISMLAIGIGLKRMEETK